MKKIPKSKNKIVYIFGETELQVLLEGPEVPGVSLNLSGRRRSSWERRTMLMFRSRQPWRNWSPTASFSLFFLLVSIEDNGATLLTSYNSVTLGMTTFISSYNYQFTESLDTLFSTQMEVFDEETLWMYLEGDFLDGIYNEVWYNDGDTS